MAENDPNFIFEQQRPRLFGLAYRMLGAVADAEDIVQDAWARWHQVNHRQINNAQAFLTTIVTRLALDKLRAIKRKKETYVGTWLPEPLLDQDLSPSACQPDKALEKDDDISMALILTLETLSAPERAAFLLHDVFDVTFEEIAETLDRSTTTCRKLASRARQKIRAARPEPFLKTKLDAPLITSFQNAVKTGDLETFSKFLAKDAVMITDGGGIKSATLNPIYGRDKIMRFFIGLLKKGPAPEHFKIKPTSINGSPGLLIKEPDQSLQTWAIEWTNRGQIAQLYIMRNPQKLNHVAFDELPV